MDSWREVVKWRGSLSALVGLVALVGLGAPVSAQDTGAERVDLDEVVNRFVSNNRELKRSKMAESRARVLLTGEEDALAPVLSFNVSYLHSDEPTQGLFEDGLRITDVVQGEARLTKRFRWGTTIALSLDTNRIHTFQPFTLPGGNTQTTEIGPNWSENLTLRLVQPLLKGFGEDINLANVAFAEGSVAISELETRRSASTSALEALTRYLELVYADLDVNIKEAQLEILEEQREATDALLSAGKVAATELDVVGQRALVTEESLLVAIHQRDSHELDLQRLLGEDGAGRRLDPQGVPTLRPLPADDASVQRAALALSPELALLRQQIEAKRVEVETTSDGVLPQLDFTLAVGQRGLSDSFFDATRQVATLKAGNVLVGLMFSVPLGDDRADAQQSAARMELDELELQLEDSEARVKVEVDKAIRLVRLSERRVDLSSRSVELARRNLQAEQARFKAGRSTNQSVLQYQEELERAEVRHARSKVDLLLSIAQLRHLSGELLDELGIEVK